MHAYGHAVCSQTVLDIGQGQWLRDSCMLCIPFDLKKKTVSKFKHVSKFVNSIVREPAR